MAKEQKQPKQQFVAFSDSEGAIVSFDIKQLVVVQFKPQDNVLVLRLKSVGNIVITCDMVSHGELIAASTKDCLAHHVSYDTLTYVLELVGLSS